MLHNAFWETEISITENSLLFAEGELMWVTSEKFYELANKSSNYFVILSRDLLPYIPGRSIGFYEFKTEGTQHTLVPYRDFTIQMREEENW